MQVFSQACSVKGNMWLPDQNTQLYWEQMGSRAGLTLGTRLSFGNSSCFLLLQGAVKAHLNKPAHKDLKSSIAT